MTKTKTIALKAKIPARTCKKKYKVYGTYKRFLIKDFNERCGYCDSLDKWGGGKNVFHIDHFVPWKRFKNTHPDIKTDYNNLVYACPYCNRFKSDDWTSNDPNIPVTNDEGYIDPCDVMYDSSFLRNASGEIIPLTKTAEYIYKSLSLGLERHCLIWQLEKLESQIDELEKLIKDNRVEKAIKKLLSKQKALLHDNFYKVLKKFFKTLK